MVLYSALLYVLAFLCSPWLGCLSWAAFVPLWYSVLNRRVYSFKHGYVWGLVSFGGTFWFSAVLLHTQADGVGRELGYVLLICYCAIYSGLWFWAATRLSNTIWSWLATTYIYWYLVTSRIFFIIGHNEGISMVCPYLPLCEWPWMSRGLLAYGHHAALLLFLVVPLLFVNAVCGKHTRHSLLLASGALILIVFGSFFTHSGCEIPKLGYVAPPDKHLSLWDGVQEIVSSIEAVHDLHQDVVCCIAPESTLRFPINNYERCMQTLAMTRVPCIIGAHGETNGNLYNKFYYFKNGPIIQAYEKQHRFPFVEYLPTIWNQIPFFKGLFLSKCRPFSAPCSERPIMMFGSLPFIPMICSDFFFASAAPCGNEPIVVLVNDSWFMHTPYFQRVLWLYARMQAMTWGRGVVYVSHTGGWVLKPDGSHQRMIDRYL